MEKKSALSKGQKTKALLLEKAIGVFAQKSYHSATVDDVAKSAGLAKGTLYQYYRSKKDLLLACLDAWQHNMDLKPHEDIQDGDFESAENFQKALNKSFESFFEHYNSNTRLQKVLSTTRERGVDIEMGVQQSYYRLIKSYEKILQKASDALLIGNDLTVTQQANCLVALLYRLAYQYFMVEGRIPSASLTRPLTLFASQALGVMSSKSQNC